MYKTFIYQAVVRGNITFHHITFVHCLEQRENNVLYSLNRHAQQSVEDKFEGLFEWRFIAFQLLLVCLLNEDPLMSNSEHLC